MVIMSEAQRSTFTAALGALRSGTSELSVGGRGPFQFDPKNGQFVARMDRPTDNPADAECILLFLNTLADFTNRVANMVIAEDSVLIVPVEERPADPRETVASAGVAATRKPIKDVKERYRERPDKREKPLAFLWRVWQAHIDAGELYQFQLHKIDKALMKAVRNHCYRNDKMVEEFIPSKSDFVDAEISTFVAERNRDGSLWHKRRSRNRAGASFMQQSRGRLVTSARRRKRPLEQEM